MNRCCGSCKKWRKITGRTGQCSSDSNYVEWEEPTKFSGVYTGKIQYRSPVMTPIDDYCDHYERRQ